jgi:hypothetical protein
MATDTSTSTTVEPAENQQHRLLRVLQHVGVFGLLASFQIVYASFIVAVNEAFAPARPEFPLWFDVVLQTGIGIPVVVVLALAGHYVASIVTGDRAGDWWRWALYAAGIAALVLPVFNYLAPQAAGAF